MQDSFINSKNSLKTFDGEDAFITSGSTHGKNSCCSLIQNDKDEDKLADCNLSCSQKSLNSFRKKLTSPGTIELNSTQYRKNQMEEHSKVNQIGKKLEEGLAHPLDGVGDVIDASLISLVKDRNSKSTKKEHRSLKEEISSISTDSFKTLQGSNAQTHEDHVAFGDKINFKDHCMEKPVVSVIHKCSDGLKIGRRFSLGKRDRNKNEETYRHYDALNKPSSKCISSMDISPDNVLGVMGEKQFWKARRTIINQQRIFFMQVFELHRLIKVQRLIARSPYLVLEDNLLLDKPPLKTFAFKKLQSDCVNEQPSSVVKLDSKIEKPNTIEHAKNNVVRKIPLPCVNDINKGHANHLSNFGHHLGNLALTSVDINTKHYPSYIYPPPGNQWLVPVMSPSEGLLYKPIIRPCPLNAGFIAPIYGAFGTMSSNTGSKDVQDEALARGPHQRMSSSSLPQFLPPCGPPFMHPSILASAIEHMGQSYGLENHHLTGEVNSTTVVCQSSSNMSSQTSQAMSRDATTYHSSKDKELQRSTASSPSKKVIEDVLPLFPVAPTLWPSTIDRNTYVEHQPRVIKAMPHNPKSTMESAARIFRSIQEERKHL